MRDTQWNADDAIDVVSCRCSSVGRDLNPEVCVFACVVAFG